MADLERHLRQDGIDTPARSPATPEPRWILEMAFPGGPPGGRRPWYWARRTSWTALLIAFKRPFVAGRARRKASVPGGSPPAPTGQGGTAPCGASRRPWGGRGCMKSPKTALLDLSRYSAAGSEKLFVQDFYAAVKSGAWPPWCWSIGSAATPVCCPWWLPCSEQGEIPLPSRYAEQKGHAGGDWHRFGAGRRVHPELLARKVLCSCSQTSPPPSWWTPSARRSWRPWMTSARPSPLPGPPWRRSPGGSWRTWWTGCQRQLQMQPHLWRGSRRSKRWPTALPRVRALTPSRTARTACTGPSARRNSDKSLGPGGGPAAGESGAPCGRSTPRRGSLTRVGEKDTTAARDAAVAAGAGGAVPDRGAAAGEGLHPLPGGQLSKSSSCAGSAA